MPLTQLKNLAKKHGVKMKTAEKKWQEAKDIVSKEYDEDSPKYWGTVMNITKNKLAKHSKKSEDLDLEMPLFSVNESHPNELGYMYQFANNPALGKRVADFYQLLDDNSKEVFFNLLDDIYSQGWSDGCDSERLSASENEY